ncbi:hypothetical protein N9A93_03340 [Akkermansiaceae bacterium]|nr:hypothetical protein [Akkermansiaceae bacterium]
MTILASLLVALSDPCETTLGYDMEGIHIFRLIGVCGLLVAAWCVEVVGFATFRSEVSNGSPKMNVVDFDKDFSKKGSDKLLVGYGHDFNMPFVSPNETQKRIEEHQRSKWLGLLAGLAGAFGVFSFANKIWDDWVISITCVMFGPLGVAWGLKKSHGNG